MDSAVVQATEVKEMAKRIAQEAPNLVDLTQEQLEQIAKLVITQKLTQELSTAAHLAGIDYQTERTLFIENAGKTNSKHTRRGYTEALTRLEQFADKVHSTILELSPAQADDYIYSLLGVRSSASIRRDVAVASSFFTFLERRHQGIRNPFRGTRARPAHTIHRIGVYPSVDEVELLLTSVPPILTAVIAVMAFRGLRAGALPVMSIKGGRFFTHSKGKDLSGVLPELVIKTITHAGLELRSPFIGLTDTRIENRIIYHTKRLHQVDKLQAPYSAHDFRHFFAITEYSKDKDIYRVSKLLGHAGIRVTETYLKGLGVIE